MRAIALATAVWLVATACSAPSTSRPSAYGPFRDRAHRDEAWGRLTPWEQARLRAQAGSNPDLARQWQQGLPDLPGEDVPLDPELEKKLRPPEAPVWP